MGRTHIAKGGGSLVCTDQTMHMSGDTQAQTQLSAELVAFLGGPQLVMVTTIDADTKWPSNNLITWVLAKDAGSVRLAADAKGRVLGNIRADGRVLLTVMTGGACYVIEGAGRVIADELQGVSLKLGCAEIQVQHVRNVTFWGGKITTEPAYTVTYDQALKEKLDNGVFAALRSL